MFEYIKFYKPTSKQLAIISLLFWIVSLFNVALVSYHGVTMNGLPIVLIGILSGNLAWFANPLLLLILIALIKRSKSKKTIFILLVIILAINTIFLDEFSLSAAGSHIIYGYGLGFILWVISINIAFIAVGIQYQELDFEETKIIGKAILYLGIFSLFSILIGTAFYNTQKYKNASYAEKKKLSTVFLKKGSTCTSEINVLFSPLIGALEVFHPAYHGANQPQNPAYMFNSPRKLLYWGIPLIHMRGFDYSLLRNNNEILLTASVSNKKPTFQLKISQSEITHSVRTVLKQKGNKEMILFDQVWKNIYKRHYKEQIFCPEFKVHPKYNENPKKIILEALQISSKSPKLEKRINTNRVEAHTFNEKTIKLDENKTTYEYLSTNSFYNNCPNNIYVPSFREEPYIDGDMFDRAVKIDETYYFTQAWDFKSRGFRGYSCSQNYLYLYSDMRAGHNGDNTIVIQKRSIKDFTLISSNEVHYEEGKHLSNGVKILTAYEYNDNLFIELFYEENEDKKKLITISVKPRITD